MANAMATRFNVVGIATSGREALRLVGACRPRVTVLDIQLREENGLDLVPHLTQLGTRILVYTMHDISLFQNLVASVGAAGLVGKGDPEGALTTAVQTLATGGTWFPPLPVISPGERELGRRRLSIVALLRDGCAVKDLPDHLHVGKQTVDFHIKVLKRKLQVDTLAAAVAEAIRRGYILPPGLEPRRIIGVRPRSGLGT